MNEMFILAAVAITMLGMGCGVWERNNSWKDKAKCVTRMECRGKLYWVIEDGDVDKLNHVNHCFEK